MTPFFRGHALDRNDTVTDWILQVKEGDDGAAERLFQRYFERLVRLARQQLDGVARRASDEEDVAQNAFASFYKAVELGRFPNLRDRDDLWRLLFRITARKAIDVWRHEGADKRGGGRTLDEAALGDPYAESNAQLAQVIGDDPSPSFVAATIEQYTKLLEQLNDEELTSIVQLKLEGYTNQEIAQQCDCSIATIERRLRLIRKKWQRDSSDE